MTKVSRKLAPALVLTIGMLALPAILSAQSSDVRDSFKASFFAGVGIDSFAAGELKRVLNPEASNDIQERFVGGFEFEYRIAQFTSQSASDQRLWIYGKTAHGVRSTDFDCSKSPDIAVCKNSFDPIRVPQRTIYVLRRASSLEAFMGVRYEFLPLNFTDINPSTIYLKSEYGFLTVSKSANDLVDDHQWLALGAVATGGRFQDSFLEMGFGRTDLFAAKSRDRWKITGYLEFPTPIERMKGFAEMTADTDFGHGSDSVQTYVGITLDLDRLFRR